MKEHAIPQDITGYKFHIVGNMTLKQFAETAMGFVIAFFIYKTNLYEPIKWSLIMFFAPFGAALAFLPIEERPLDHWVVTFFTVLYKPTKFYWKKKSKIPEAFTYESNKETKLQVDEVDLTPQRRQRISEYMQSVKSVQEIDEEELYYQQRSSQILSIFNDHSIKINTEVANERIKQKPNLKVQVRSLIATEGVSDESAQPDEKTLTEKKLIYDLPQADIKYEKQAEDYQAIQKKTIGTDDVANEIAIPEKEKIRVDELYRQEQELMKQTVNENGQQQNPQERTVFVKTDNQQKEEPIQSVSVTVNQDLPFPTKPTKPNKLVGMVLSQNNELIDNATITLVDSNNTPVTAVKSNALGQFFVSSQLRNGTYIIEVTKTGTSFFPVSIELKGEIVDPLEIRSVE